MPTFYIIRKSDRSLVRRTTAPINTLTNETDTELCLMQVESDVIPAFNPATQKLVRVFTDNDALYTRTFSYTVSALTQAELNALTSAQQTALTKQEIKAAYTAMVNGTGTAAERIARLEKAVAYLLRQEVN